MAQNRFYSSTAQKTSLNGGISNSATSIVVLATTGFPVSFPYTLIIERDTVNEEVVKVTGAAGTTLTVARGQDGTSGIAHGTGVAVEHGVSAQDFNEPQAHIAASAAVHGLAGTVVGTTDAQTLTNKTVNLSSNTLTGTKAQFNTACSDADFATIAGVETLTSKTLTTPTINGGLITGAIVDAATFSGTATGTISGANINNTSINAASTIGGVSGTSLAADRTAWTTYTPTFTNITSPSGEFAYKQIGKTLFLRFYFASGTANAVQPTVSLPAGLTGATVTSAQVLCIGGTTNVYLAKVVGTASTVFLTEPSGTINGDNLTGVMVTGVIEVA